MDSTDIAEVRRVHDAVVEFVTSVNLESIGVGRTTSYPAGWCSTMAQVLRQELGRRGLGRWRIANGQNGIRFHDWLELVVDGVIVASVDATLHQFPEVSSIPFIGLGETPSVRVFSLGRKYATSDDEVQSWVTDWDRAICTAVRDALA